MYFWKLTALTKMVVLQCYGTLDDAIQSVLKRLYEEYYRVEERSIAYYDKLINEQSPLLLLDGPYKGIILTTKPSKFFN